MNDHYDVIIIGSGAGGSTLLNKLAPSGKRILVLERGPFLPREKENWDPRLLSTPRATSALKSGMTRTVARCARGCVITSAGTPSFTARLSYVCASAIS